MSIILVGSILFLISVLFLLSTKERSTKKTPPGSLGIPVIGQSLSFLRAMRANTAEKWLGRRIEKYGPISKLSLFGKPTVFLHGHAANKFIFTSADNIIANSQIKSIQTILGDRSLLELTGDDHKRVRSALMVFLKPESLKQNVGIMEDEIRTHFETHFNIMSSLIFGLGKGDRRDKLVLGFQQIMDGMWSVPINLPFTRYNRSLKASKIVQKMVKQLIREKREEIETRPDSQQQDLITCLLHIRSEDNEQPMSEKEIVQNVVLVMIAGHETSSILITFIMSILANEPSIYEAVLQEQEEIARSKSPGEFLTWEDLAKMKYTWRVALETLRVTPPIFGSFRTAIEDIEYGGYLIP